MRKTLIITLEYPPQIGGIASYVYNLCAHLPANDFVLYAVPSKGDKEFDAVNGWKVLRRTPYWPFIWPHWLRLYFQVKKIIKEEKIQQIHVHHVLPVGYVAYLLKKFNKIPYIIFLHGTDIEMAMQKKMKKFVRICLSAQNIVVNSQFLKHKLESKIEKLPAIKIVYPCPGEIFNTPYDQALLDSLRAKLALKGKKVIITVARMAEGKGYPHLTRIISQLLNKIPNLVWLVVGDGPKKLAIIEQVQKNNLQNIVRFLGNVPYSELPKYYQLADLFVLLTHKDENSEEGWGTVFLEAGASGLPAIAGRAGGVEEAVEHGKTGLIVDVYQDAMVEAAIIKLLTDDVTRQQMATAVKERTASLFNWGKQAQSLYE